MATARSFSRRRGSSCRHAGSRKFFLRGLLSREAENRTNFAAPTGAEETFAGMRPRAASRLSATRSVTPNFASSEDTWNFTVRSATFSFEAISLFAQPCTMQSRTSCSRRLTFTPAPRARPAASNSWARSATASSSDVPRNNHHFIIFRRLASYQAMHREQTCNLFHRHAAVRFRIDTKTDSTRGPLTQNITLGKKWRSIDLCDSMDCFRLTVSVLASQFKVQAGEKDQFYFQI